MLSVQSSFPSKYTILEVGRARAEDASCEIGSKLTGMMHHNNRSKWQNGVQRN